MTGESDRIVDVRVVTILHKLEVPILYGNWVMRHREFALIRIDTESGAQGFGYCLTRDGPIAQIVERTIAPVYVGADPTDPAGNFFKALWTSHAVHAAGIGMRALSVVDIAAWDLAAKLAGMSIAGYLGGEARPMPATAIVGYPPNMSPADIADQVAGLWADGWRRFKVPISPSIDASVARLEAARKAAPDAWLGFDINMVFTTVEQVVEFERSVRHLGLGWIEDVLPPGDADALSRVRGSIETPLAMGDEQGGSYYPQAMVAADAVDVVRIDVTTDGGVTRLRQIVPALAERGVMMAPHMFPHVHSRVLAALGQTVPIEWGIPGTGVHPMDDSLGQPVVRDGVMEPLPEAPGFGRLVDPDWIRRQEFSDPGGALEGLE